MLVEFDVGVNMFCDNITSISAWCLVVSNTMSQCLAFYCQSGIPFASLIYVRTFLRRCKMRYIN